MKRLFTAAVAAIAMAMAGSASASIIFDTGSLGGLTQVHSTGSQDPATTVYGQLQGGGPKVSVHSSSNLSVDGAGYAQFDGPFSTVDFFFTTYTGGFNAANFGLFAAGVEGRNGVPVYLDVFAYDLNNNLLPVYLPGGVTLLNNYSLGQGLNSFNISVTNGEVLSRLAFAAYADTANTTPRTLGDIRHIDLNLVPTSAVPEPATWAMLIFGFGAVGSMLRAARRKGALAAA